MAYARLAAYAYAKTEGYVVAHEGDHIAEPCKIFPRTKAPQRSGKNAARPKRPWLRHPVVRWGQCLSGEARRRVNEWKPKGDEPRTPSRKNRSKQRPSDEASEVVSSARALDHPTGTPPIGTAPSGRT
jgi:hypothetical protein